MARGLDTLALQPVTFLEERKARQEKQDKEAVNHRQHKEAVNGTQSYSVSRYQDQRTPSPTPASITTHELILHNCNANQNIYIHAQCPVFRPTPTVHK